MQERLDPSFARHHQCPDADRAAELVGCDAQGNEAGSSRARLGPQAAEGQWDVAERADSVDVQGHIGIDAGSRCFHERLQGSDFVVGGEERGGRGISPAYSAPPRLESSRALQSTGTHSSSATSCVCSQLSVSSVA